MKRKLAVVFLAIAVVGVLGCTIETNSSSNDNVAGVSGTWNGTGNYYHNNVPVTQFTLNLSQTGNAISGNYAIKRDARSLMSGSINGIVSGNDISLTMNPHGHASGTVSGNTMSLIWTEPGFGGGSWTGNKQATVQISR